MTSGFLSSWRGPTLFWSSGIAISCPIPNRGLWEGDCPDPSWTTYACSDLYVPGNPGAGTAQSRIYVLKLFRMQVAENMKAKSRLNTSGLGDARDYVHMFW